MTAGAASRGGSAPLDRWLRPSLLARWAVAIAAAVVVALVVSFAVLAAAYAVGGWAAIDDTWVGLIVVVSLLGGLLASLLACVLAVIAKMKHERLGVALASPIALSGNRGLPGAGRAVLVGVATVPEHFP